MNQLFRLIEKHRSTGRHGLTVPFIVNALAVVINPNVHKVVGPGDDGSFVVSGMTPEIASKICDAMIAMLSDKGVPQAFSLFKCKAVRAYVIGIVPGSHGSQKPLASPSDIFYNFGTWISTNDAIKMLKLDLSRSLSGICSRGVVKNKNGKGMRQAWMKSFGKYEAELIAQTLAIVKQDEAKK